MITGFFRLSPKLWINCMSSLIRSKSKSCSTSREEKPVPKSSIQTLKPASWKRRICSFRYSWSMPCTVSVISIMSISGESSASLTRLLSSDTMSQHSKSYREMLTENLTIGRCSSLRLFISCRASSAMRRSSLYNSLASSRTGMNSPGESMPRVGSFQRASASLAQMAPVELRMMDW